MQKQYDGSSLRSEPRAARTKPTARGSRVVVTAVCDAINAKGLPPMDERLKSILAGQAGVLLRGGWPLEDVRQAAIDLALAWDEKRGHNRLCHLASRVRSMEASLREREHREFMRMEYQFAQGMRQEDSAQNPSFHGFEQDPAAPANTCKLCRGPYGVHVRPRVDAA